MAEEQAWEVWGRAPRKTHGTTWRERCAAAGPTGTCAGRCGRPGGIRGVRRRGFRRDMLHGGGASMGGLGARPEKDTRERVAGRERGGRPNRNLCGEVRKARRHPRRPPEGFPEGHAAWRRSKHGRFGGAPRERHMERHGGRGARRPAQPELVRGGAAGPAASAASAGGVSGGTCCMAEEQAWEVWGRAPRKTRGKEWRVGSAAAGPTGTCAGRCGRPGGIRGVRRRGFRRDMLHGGGASMGGLGARPEKDTWNDMEGEVRGGRPNRNLCGEVRQARRHPRRPPEGFPEGHAAWRRSKHGRFGGAPRER